MTESQEKPQDRQAELGAALEEQMQMMLRRVFPDATEAEKEELKKVSEQLVLGEKPPNDELLAGVATAMSAITSRLALESFVSQHRMNQWFEYLGFAATAHDLLEGITDEAEAKLLVNERFTSVESLPAAERLLMHVASFIRANLDPIFPKGTEEQLHMIASICVTMREDPELGEQLTDHLNSLLAEGKMVTDDTDRAQRLDRLNLVMDAVDREYHRMSAQIVREDLDKYEAALLAPDADGKLQYRGEMRQLLRAREALLQEMTTEIMLHGRASDDKATEFNEGAARLDQLSEIIFRRSATLH